MSDINRIDRNGVPVSGTAPADANANAQDVNTPPADPAALAALAAQRGAVAIDGVPFAASSAASAATAHDAPPLPDVTGPGSGSAGASLARPAWLEMRPYNLAAATDAMTEAQAQQQTNATKNKVLAGQNSYLMQVAGVGALQQQIAGERQGAAEKLGTAVVATVAAAGFGALGTKLTLATKAPMPGLGAAMTAGAQGISQLVNAAGDAGSKLSSGGGQHKADEAKIQKAIIDTYQAIYKTQEDIMGTVIENNRRNLQAQYETERNVKRDVSQSLLGVANNL